ncbi:C39 family peptidase [Mycobacterium shigaense]|uniref:Peptidase C39-like domain-containing protein n=1 Tax=Mycobacterium shigaense TaxID=722731 RepID=A0A1Z4EPM7_9MYCO|nr:C39 family peptidase [Mycobacterium shigaense]MEA1122565.1 C39 family peptidase [Mycobacterium shigaense]BAX94836.1 hypothetical protein MSG_04724 [Mycobacterium shigaense]
MTQLAPCHATTARFGVLAAMASAAVAAAAATAVAIGSAGTTEAAPGPAAQQAEPGMHGDPVAAGRFWHYQQQTFDCGEMAVADVIGEITGRSPTEDEITGAAANIPSVAHPGPIYNGGKTSNRDLPVLLAHYGVAADINHPGTDALIQRLDDGRKVIVGVNDKVLWNTRGNRTQENHFVVITGIDTTTNTVHMNDSGIAAGRDEQVSIATFEKAWAASDNFAVVTR